MASYKANFRHGDPLMIDYIAGANVAAGDIVLLGNTAGLCNGVAHKDIANGDKGALAAGGGVYWVKVASNYAAWTKLYWDATNTVLTSTSTNMSQFGYNIEAAAAANAVIEVLHWPRA
jgi:predicted RecA/RadA family phage recombinase